MSQQLTREVSEASKEVGEYQSTLQQQGALICAVATYSSK